MIGLGVFLRRRCRRLRHFDGGEVAAWLRSVDRALLDHAWQDAPFIGPANVVFVYLLARDAVDPDIVTAGELQAVIMACLYVAFSYVGCEISYPLKVRHRIIFSYLLNSALDQLRTQRSDQACLFSDICWIQASVFFWLNELVLYKIVRESYCICDHNFIESSGKYTTVHFLPFC